MRFSCNHWATKRSKSAQLRLIKLKTGFAHTCSAIEVFVGLEA